MLECQKTQSGYNQIGVYDDDSDYGLIMVRIVNNEDIIGISFDLTGWEYRVAIAY